MLKAPQPGQVKTRLGHDIGMVGAAWWMRHQIRALLRNISDPRWDLALAIAPDTAIRAPIWPAGLPRLAQGQGDLGTRMARALRQAPPGPTCLIGADIPALRRPHIARAFAALGRADAVFGPARDGGYWLIGLRHGGAVPASLFRNVRWSSPDALRDSIASLPGARIALVDTLADVDNAADLAAHRRLGFSR